MIQLFKYTWDNEYDEISSLVTLFFGATLRFQPDHKFGCHMAAIFSSIHGDLRGCYPEI